MFVLTYVYASGTATESIISSSRENLESKLTSDISTSVTVKSVPGSKKRYYYSDDSEELIAIISPVKTLV